jgi:hypothetical protein
MGEVSLIVWQGYARKAEFAGYPFSGRRVSHAALCPREHAGAIWMRLDKAALDIDHLFRSEWCLLLQVERPSVYPTFTTSCFE